MAPLRELQGAGRTLWIGGGSRGRSDDLEATGGHLTELGAVEEPGDRAGIVAHHLEGGGDEVSQRGLGGGLGRAAADPGQGTATLTAKGGGWGVRFAAGCRAHGVGDSCGVGEGGTG